MKAYDICIITSANEYQAMGYKNQIEWRKKIGVLTDETEFLVYSDPQNKRIGSGGSTIYVLYKLLERVNFNFDKAFRNKRILIFHSGGDSRRLPAYSAMGKIFIPLPIENFFSLFDVMLNNLMHLPFLNGGQVIISSGDVLINFEPDYIKFSDSGVTGVAYPDSIDVALGHGVYIAQIVDPEDNPTKVDNFLQKPSLEELQASKALDMSNRALVDTGIINLSIDAIDRVLGDKELCKMTVKGDIYLDLYKDIIFAILGKEDIRPISHLKEIPFSVSILPYCGFFHVGESSEFLHNLYSITHASFLYKFNKFIRSNIKTCHTFLRDSFVFNTIIESENIKIKKPILIEGSYINEDLSLEGENILTGVTRNSGSIFLKKGICLALIPIENDNWSSVIYGINDDFKNTIEDSRCTFLNMSFSEWLQRTGISADNLWDKDEKHEIWNAKLFPVSKDPRTAIQESLKLQYDGLLSETWKLSSRVSMKEILQITDHKRLLERYSWIFKNAKIINISNMITANDELSSSEILNYCQEADDYAELFNSIVPMINRSDNPLFQARLYKLLSEIIKTAVTIYPNIDLGRFSLNYSAEELDLKAFEHIRNAIGTHISRHILPEKKRINIRPDEVVWVCAPVRLDFAGGWSDTPPYCLERGGSVLNAAVKLNGQYPIQVIGKVHPEPIIRINSIDLEKNVVISDICDLISSYDPNDWLSLPKAAFVAAGIISQYEKINLRDILKEFGFGIDLTLFSAVPSGSGLGTSSILGAAIIACLWKIFNIKFTQEILFNCTLYLEQLMTTGGGWQDQIGGIVGGVKLIQTLPGLIQSPKISWTDLKYPNMQLSDRFLLYYTGYRRMAKDILHQIVGRYLKRDRLTLDTINQLRKISIDMKESLDYRDIDSFGSKIREVWELNKKLDPGTSNNNIENILSKIDDYICGAKLLGAGGGGFLFIVTRGISQSQKIRQILTEDPPNDLARFFDFDIDPEGLKITVF